MEIQFYSLFSGSKGNCSFFRYGNCTFLIDAGVSKKQIDLALSEIGESLDSVNAILVTHEHSDHVKGLPMIGKHYPRLPIFIPKKSLNHLKDDCGRYVPFDDVMELKSKKEDVTVRAFKTYHDSYASVGYSIYTPCGQVVVCTDTGIVSNEMIEEIKGCRGLVLEANYDKQMLKNGSYPASLKSRIDSKFGHLSNNDCGDVLCKIFTSNLESVILGHLSEENNLPNVALETVTKIFIHPEVDVKVARKNECVKLF